MLAANGLLLLLYICDRGALTFSHARRFVRGRVLVLSAGLFCPSGLSFAVTRIPFFFHRKAIAIFSAICILDKITFTWSKVNQLSLQFFIISINIFESCSVGLSQVRSLVVSYKICSRDASVTEFLRKKRSITYTFISASYKNHSSLTTTKTCRSRD